MQIAIPVGVKVAMVTHHLCRQENAKQRARMVNLQEGGEGTTTSASMVTAFVAFVANQPSVGRVALKMQIVKQAGAKVAESVLENASAGKLMVRRSIAKIIQSSIRLLRIAITMSAQVQQASAVFAVRRLPMTAHVPKRQTASLASAGYPLMAPVSCAEALAWRKRSMGSSCRK